MSEMNRKMRATKRRTRMVISRSRFGESEVDDFPVFGAEAISLVTALTHEAWSISGRQRPDYDRMNTPYRFVPGFPE